MAAAKPPLMRQQLITALDLFSHLYCYNDGRIVEAEGTQSVGAIWVMESRVALGLDPITGKRAKRKPRSKKPA